MALHTVHCPTIAPELFDTERTWIDPDGDSIDVAAICLRGFRNAHRTKFTADGVLNNTTGYTVSDIATLVKGNISIHFFWIRDNTARVEWGHGVAYNNSSTSPDLDEWLGGSGANLRLHTRAVGSNVTHTAAPGAGLATFFNNNFDTASAAGSAGFDDTTALTFTGGDFGTLAFDPDSLAGIQILRPSHTEYGLTWETNSAEFVNTCMTYDDARGTVIILQDDDAWSSNFYLAIMGDGCMDPASGTDTNMSAVAQATINANGIGLVTTSCQAYALDESSVLQTYDWDTTNPGIPPSGHIIDEGGNLRYDWRSMRLINGTGGGGTKGAFFKELVSVIGPTENIFDGMTRRAPVIQNGVSMVKYSQILALAHESNVPLFPFCNDLGLRAGP